MGDITRKALETQLAATFGAWRLPSEPRGVFSSRVSPVAGSSSSISPRARGPRVALVDRPGAPQSEVRVAVRAFSANDPDRIPAAVLNAVLGGESFTSRLNLNIRERNLYSYWVWTDLWLRRMNGWFQIGTSVTTADTGAAIREVLRELAVVESEDVPPAELEGAKASLVQSLNGKLVRVQDVAQRVGEIFRYGFATDELASLPARIGAVTAADVRRVAARLARSESQTVVVVGDLNLVRPQLAALAPSREVVVDAYGDELPPSPQTAKAAHP